MGTVGRRGRRGVDGNLVGEEINVSLNVLVHDVGCSPYSLRNLSF